MVIQSTLEVKAYSSYWQIWQWWPWPMTPKSTGILCNTGQMWTECEEGSSRCSQVIDQKQKGYRETDGWTCAKQYALSSSKEVPREHDVHSLHCVYNGCWDKQQLKAWIHYLGPENMSREVKCWLTNVDLYAKLYKCVEMYRERIQDLRIHIRSVDCIKLKTRLAIW